MSFTSTFVPSRNAAVVLLAGAWIAAGSSLVAAADRPFTEMAQTVNSLVLRPGEAGGSGEVRSPMGRTSRVSAIPHLRTAGDLPVPSDAVVFREQPAKSFAQAVTAAAVRQDPGLVTANSSNLLHSFQGLDDNGTYVPPAVAGVVGLNDVMVAHNSEVRIQTKSGKQRLRVSLLSWWQTYFSSLTDVFSPRVGFDPYNNRWIMVAAAESSSANSCVLVAASMSSDPTGLWRAVKLTADNSGVSWSDEPRMGFN